MHMKSVVCNICRLTRQTCQHQTAVEARDSCVPCLSVVNNSVYTYLQAHLVTLTEEKKAATLSYLNELNNEFNMLKYSINPQGNVILTFSIPAGDDKSDPALVFALVDRLKAHLDTHYSA